MIRKSQKFFEVFWELNPARTRSESITTVVKLTYEETRGHLAVPNRIHSKHRASVNSDYMRTRVEITSIFNMCAPSSVPMTLHRRFVAQAASWCRIYADAHPRKEKEIDTCTGRPAPQDDRDERIYKPAEPNGARWVTQSLLWEVKDASACTILHGVFYSERPPCSALALPLFFFSLFNLS